MKSVSLLKNVPNVPDNYFSLIFGRQIEYRYQIADYTKSAKQIHLSQKRQSYKAAIKHFKSLYNPTSYYIPKINCDPNYYDDSFLVYFKK